MSPVFVLDPLADARWDEFLDRHPRASVFHTRGWLEALRRTYGYEPIVLTTTGEGPLEDGLVTCRVRTLLSRRLVSLPFSDHCDPLVDAPGGLREMIEFLRAEVDGGGWRSFEFRPRPGTSSAECLRVAEFAGAERRPVPAAGRPFSVAESGRYWLHALDLAREPGQVFDGFHHSSTQRAIRRAEREGVTYEAGASEALLAGFYPLVRLTRRRHGLPPQPIAWFQNLLACVGGAHSTRSARPGQGVTIHLARVDGRPIAGILTLTFKKAMVYKYGGSDAAHHRLGGMSFLFWQAIQRAQAAGIEELDLGRSDLDQPGLVAFKDHLGAARSPLAYYTYPARRHAAVGSGALGAAARSVMSRLPDAALDLTGRVLYKHLG